MKVYKFGGASVGTSEGIRNIASIIRASEEELFVVVSAMGKTTNAMEDVLDSFMKAAREEALSKLESVFEFHNTIIGQLFDDDAGMLAVDPIYSQIRKIIQTSVGDDYDKWYDQLVSFGEIISTTIVSAYLQKAGINNCWVDMRELLITDSNFREANVKLIESEKRLRTHIRYDNIRVYIGQGFIGANQKGNPTTLGREGSDYTAAVVGNLLDASSVTIWKDVPGILNADPRIFDNTVLIPQLTYQDAVELAYSGAQIIHPKTLKPLENKGIPLYVKPFNDFMADGSVICSLIDNPVNVPVFILKKKQVLLTMRPHDFSFVLEDSLPKAFNIMQKHRLKISMIQSSAISISVCVDNSRYLSGALDELSNDFKVSYNENLELLTIRGISAEIAEKHCMGREVMLTQRTRRIGRFLMREQ